MALSQPRSAYRIDEGPDAKQARVASLSALAGLITPLNNKQAMLRLFVNLNSSALCRSTS